MKFSAQEEYGLRCLLQIARAGKALTIPEIAKAEGLTQSHVAKLMRVLRTGGFVAAARGSSGGYALAATPNEIIVGEVLAYLGGKLYDDEFCAKHSGTELKCTHSVDCSIRSLWSSVQFAVDEVVTRLTIADLLPKEELVRL
jgi:Rrf2 family protein